MYYEHNIKGNKNDFIFNQAVKWMKMNLLKDEDDENEWADGLYCFVEFNRVYKNGYSHSIIHRNESKYLVLVTRLFQNRANPHGYIMDLSDMSINEML